jgi:hypothetical protein
MKKISLLILILFFLTSCGSAKEAGKVLRNEKTRTTDEFLVKKREPLVLPPDYDQIPEPGTGATNEESKEDEKIRDMIKGPKEKNLNKNKSSSVEEKIISGIRR